MSLLRFQSPRGKTVIVLRDETLLSIALGRLVRFDVVLPPGHDPAANLTTRRAYPVLYLQDGQDLDRLRLPATLNRLYRAGALRPFVLVAVRAADRLREYGVAARPDYLGRGDRAGQYTEFMLNELLPLAQRRYGVSNDPAEVAVAGMSLGGLTAFDLAWHHPEAFGRAGAFSGSFWWRGRGLNDGYTDADRLMHSLVRARPVNLGQQFWLQTGTLDETGDRNHNGIIDAIEDTLDLIAMLKRQGLPPAAVRYLEVPGGHHHPDTWAAVLPDFLRWAFGTGPLEPAPDAARRPLPGRQRGPLARLHRPQGARRWVAQATLAHSRRAATFTAMPPAPTLTRPTPGAYLPFYQTYLDLVPAGEDPLTLLQAQAAELSAALAPLTEAQTLLRYAPGKWTPKEVLLHLIDAERVFTYRALRFARADAQDLPGYDQDAFVANSEANHRSLSDLLTEYAAVRAATCAFFGSLSVEQLDRAGRANGGPATVRAWLYIIVGHERHHLNLFSERYWPLLTGALAATIATTTEQQAEHEAQQHAGQQTEQQTPQQAPIEAR